MDENLISSVIHGTRMNVIHGTRMNRRIGTRAGGMCAFGYLRTHTEFRCTSTGYGMTLIYIYNDPYIYIYIYIQNLDAHPLDME